jgi:NAD-dependent dihydropyrimidine dehydrogenase PreA subunit
MSGKLNPMGYEYVRFDEGSCCTACALCFLSCPEPGALTVLAEEEEA